MLVPAIQYKDEIEKQFKAIQYSDKYLWYTGSIDNYDIEVKTEGDKFSFAIIDNNYGVSEVIGYISFRVDWYCSMAFNFSLIRFSHNVNGISFDKNRITRKMTSAIREVIRMVESFNLHRIDFRCVSGNPANEKYIRILTKLIEKYSIVDLIFRDNIKDTHGNYHDTICYELIRREE